MPLTDSQAVVVIPADLLSYDPCRDLIGRGAYGSVYKAECLGKSVAVKVVPCANNSPAVLQAFLQETAIMRHSIHPNVTLLLGVCVKPGQLMMVTELMQGDLSMIIDSPDIFSSFSLSQRLHMALDAACGMNWLHGICKVIHRDLKPANLLVDRYNRVKVADFGFSEFMRGNNKDNKVIRGTIKYTAPEVLLLKPFTEKADVYSYGLCLYEISTGNEVFKEFEDAQEFITAVAAGDVRPQFDEDQRLPHSLINLIERCWSADPSVRPAFPEILDRLQVAIIELALGCGTPAASFWLKNFGFHEEVPFSALAAVLQSTVPGKVSDDVLAALQKLLCGPRTLNTDACAFAECTFRIEAFHRVSECFGDFFCPETGAVFLREIGDAAQQVWLNFGVTRVAAEAQLCRAHVASSFVVRACGGGDLRAQPFAVSILTQSQSQREASPGAAEAEAEEEEEEDEDAECAPLAVRHLHVERACDGSGLLRVRAGPRLCEARGLCDLVAALQAACVLGMPCTAPPPSLDD
eukprot:TRINITY_DN246_c0_g1_i1.p1 TRINITY_DN246_c0_g1~~TRINITY_DN246_c0_g1_i1.p1  ORF type:complete len:521 (+),score=155.05 TRINITY_DN246_c0_g1_i1:154-1716(+)